MRLGDWLLLAFAIVMVAVVGLMAFRRQGMHYRPPFHAPAPSGDSADVEQHINVETDATWRELEQANELIERLRTEATLQAARVDAREREMALEVAAEKQRLRAEAAENKREAAKQTAARSRIALVAKIAEHMAPLLAGFPYNFKEVRHVGEVFDFLVYKGLENGEIEEVIFLEVKSGPGGRRNPRERALKRAVDAGRVRYEVFVPDTAGARDADHADLLESVGADGDNE